MRLYDLDLFGNNSHAGAGAKFAVNGGTPQSTQGTQGPVFTEGTDYVEFKDVRADGEGRLNITLGPRQRRDRDLQRVPVAGRTSPSHGIVPRAGHSSLGD